MYIEIDLFVCVRVCLYDCMCVCAGHYDMGPGVARII